MFAMSGSELLKLPLVPVEAVIFLKWPCYPLLQFVCCLPGQRCKLPMGLSQSSILMVTVLQLKPWLLTLSRLSGWHILVSGPQSRRRQEGPHILGKQRILGPNTPEVQGGVEEYRVEQRRRRCLCTPTPFLMHGMQ